MGRKKTLGVEAVGDETTEETVIEPVEEVVPVENEETGALMDGFDEQKDALVGKRIGGKSIFTSKKLENGDTEIIDSDMATFTVNDDFISEYVK